MRARDAFPTAMDVAEMSARVERAAGDAAKWSREKPRRQCVCSVPIRTGEGSPGKPPCIQPAAELRFAVSFNISVAKVCKEAHIAPRVPNVANPADTLYGGGRCAGRLISGRGTNVWRTFFGRLVITPCIR